MSDQSSVPDIPGSLLPLVIRNSLVPLGLVLLVMLGLFTVCHGIFIQQLHWEAILSGCFLLGCAGILYSIHMQGLSVAPVIFDQNGFQTKRYGRVSWSEVQGIYLHEGCMRGVATYTLFIRVERYFKCAPKLHWLVQLEKLFLRKQGDALVLHINCRDSKEKPETIYKVAKRLWFDATGCMSDWEPSSFHFLI